MRYRGLIHNDNDFKFFTKVSENAAQLFDAYVSLKRLSKLFPSTKFVIRPHPDENHEAWRNHFSSVDNVFVEYSGNATYWILGAKINLFWLYNCNRAWERINPPFVIIQILKLNLTQIFLIDLEKY